MAPQKSAAEVGETKSLNRAIKRNPDRFRSDFMFQLMSEEFDSLRCQSGTLKAGRGEHRKYLPYVFTEHGAIKQLVTAIRQLMSPPDPPKKEMGFHTIRDSAKEQAEPSKPTASVQPPKRRRHTDA